MVGGAYTHLGDMLASQYTKYRLEHKTSHATFNALFFGHGTSTGHQTYFTSHFTA